MSQANNKESTMYNKLVAKLHNVRKLYAKTRRDYPETARQCKINAKLIEKQIAMSKAGK